MSDAPRPVQGPDSHPVKKRNKRSALIMGAVVLAMFGFGFAMAPLYQMICSVTGINSANPTGRMRAEDYQSSHVDKNRVVRVEFDTTLNEDMPWDFRPLTKTLDVHPGQAYTVAFYARNRSDRRIIGQAIPSVTPWQATEHFRKTECFCFSNQTLEAGEEKEMPLRFIVTTELPPEIHTVTLSYTFMDTEKAAAQAAIRAAKAATAKSVGPGHNRS
jgi:cytochrome c oxidase assembly protein subunit 11